MRALLAAPCLLLACSNDLQVAATANTAPTAAINSPADGAIFVSDDVIAFQGVVGDANGLEDISSTTWVSSIDGEIGPADLSTPDAQGISRISATLTEGVHSITIRATDTAGNIGEDNIQLSVGVADSSPTATILQPDNYALAQPGQTIDLLGVVSDGQDPAESLTVIWTATEFGSPDSDEIVGPHTPDGDGTTVGVWTPTQIGTFALNIVVVDPDGEEGLSEPVFVDVEDPNAVDDDGDGLSELAGDCDDTDPYVLPGVVEICGNAKDDDCTADPAIGYDGIDDKDEDGDDHIDSACVNYNFGDRPIDDCDDSDNTVYPGAYELSDGIDNDCDGEIDNGGPNYDDDGDCFCEQSPCYGSADPTCLNPAYGDCNDDEPTAYPGNVDIPDVDYIDGNCDGIDGTITNSVFVDPVFGSNGNAGTDLASPVFDLDTALTIASNTGRTWILLASGVTFPQGDFSQGVNVVGGYDSSNAWLRDPTIYPEIALPNTGRTLSNWVVPTELQQLEISASNTSGNGSSSIVLTLDNTQNLTLNKVWLTAGDAGSGVGGLTPPVASSGSAGTKGGDGYNRGSDTYLFGGCIDPCGCPTQPAPNTGNGGSACGTGSAGGSGGASSYGGNSGSSGSSGASGGGSGGGGGSANNNGSAGGAGTTGAVGNSGSGGASFGSATASGYTPADGSTGAIGTGGTGGGGGGGGGGGTEALVCAAYGGSGGGGGGGGCGGLGGGPGTGGGASIGLLLVDSNVVLLDVDIVSGRGGDGGTGASGGTGGAGGAGGSPGLGKSIVLSSDAGDGGQGGAGGAGGQGGAGGGGGGGPSVGIVCTSNSSQITEANTLYSQTSGGAGGSSPGSVGQPGFVGDKFGC